VEIDGLFTPGNSASHVSLDSDLVLGPGSTTHIEIGGRMKGSDYDSITVSGDAALFGRLEIELTNGFAPDPGDQFLVLSAGTLSVGAFASFRAPGLPGMVFVQHVNDGTIFVSAVVPGDTDLDGDIDDADLGTAFSNYTGPVGEDGDRTWAQGDGDGDGDVDDADLGTSFAAYTGPLGPNNVPEPASLLLLAMAGSLLLRQRTR